MNKIIMTVVDKLTVFMENMATGFTVLTLLAGVVCIVYALVVSPLKTLAIIVPILLCQVVGHLINSHYNNKGKDNE